MQALQSGSRFHCPPRRAPRARGSRTSRRRSGGAESRSHNRHHPSRWCERGIAAGAAISSEGSENATTSRRVSLLWFKHDLRVDDHPFFAQSQSAQDGLVVPLFVFDPAAYSPYQETAADIEWLEKVLRSLKAKLRALGSDLVVRVGKAEDVIAEVCDQYSVDEIVTSREANCLWSDKMRAIAESAQCAPLRTYTYTMIGENTGWAYPMRASELGQWGLSAPIDPPRGLASPAIEDAAVPSAQALRDSLRGSLGSEEASAGAKDEGPKYGGAYCGSDFLVKDPQRAAALRCFDLSGDHDEVVSQMGQYFSAFQSAGAEDGGGRAESKGKESVGPLALEMEVPGGFGQSFNVLFRKHLSQGVVSPGQVYRMAEAFKQGEFPPSSSPEAQAPLAQALQNKVGWGHKGANAAMAAALKFDYAHNLHQYSLGKRRMVADERVEHKSWMWRGCHQEFLQARPSEDTEGACGEKGTIVLVHGFGAFGEHWRDNVTGLASAGYRVFCPTLPGYGRSEKASARYTPELWSEFVRDFVRDVVGEPVVIAGNSIGGYVSAYACAKNPNWFKGLVLVNTAGRLVSDAAELPFQEDAETSLDAVKKQVFSEIGSRVIFKYLEGSVPSLLAKAYPQNPARADAELAREIERASTDPGAFDVFKSVFYLPTPTPLSTLLQEYRGPRLVFQGANDPLNDARARARQLEEVCGAEVELIEAGHCPHDEVPDLFNRAMDRFAAKVVQISAEQLL